MRPARALDVLGTLVSLGLGGMLLVAAVLKAGDPPLFIQEVESYKILPGLAALGAYTFLIVEIAIALSLIFRVAPRGSLAAFAGLMLLFIGVTAYSWSQGRTEGCGCFGRLASRPPGEVIIEDSIYLTLAAFAFWRSKRWLTSARGRWIALAFSCVVGFTLPWLLPRMPVDSAITGLKAGSNLENLAADDLKAPLSEGKVFLALLGDGCTGCEAALPIMNDMTQAAGAPRVSGIFAGDRREKRAWALEHVPSFPLGHAPVKSLRQYYRRLPVFFLLDDGVVRRIWWGTPPRWIR